jgi:hypothetical protein
MGRFQKGTDSISFGVIRVAAPDDAAASAGGIATCNRRRGQFLPSSAGAFWLSYVILIAPLFAWLMVIPRNAGQGDSPVCASFPPCVSAVATAFQETPRR